MPRHLQTIVTFAVNLRLPARSNTVIAQSYVRDAILNWSGHVEANHPFALSIKSEDFTVRLLKKETLYTTTRKEPA